MIPYRGADDQVGKDAKSNLLPATVQREALESSTNKSTRSEEVLDDKVVAPEAFWSRFDQLCSQ
jgi:hypothetical protein